MKDFYWTISVPVGKVIEIAFEDLDIDGGYNCLKDYLKLYDGDYKEDTLLKSLCGTKVPQLTRSSGNKVYLHFHSDSKGTSRGFKMIWKAVDREVVVTVAPEARGKVWFSLRESRRIFRLISVSAKFSSGTCNFPNVSLPFY